MNHTRIAPVLLSVLLLASVPRASAQGVALPTGGTFTIEHYAKIARVSDVRIAPAGDRAVMVVAWPNYEANVWESDLMWSTCARRHSAP